MPRPKEYDRTTVVRAARDVFWERGYEATSLSDLEAHTGLNRSSLYQEFGSKRGLFGEALRSYVTEVAEPRLAVLRDKTGAAAVVAYLTQLAATLRAMPGRARRGCLMVNSIAELAGHDEGVDTAANAYAARIAQALGDALRGAADTGAIARDTVKPRIRLLTGVVVAVLLTARMDVEQAAELAEAAADEVHRW
jgi:AcrR family transcriptional regulator